MSDKVVIVHGRNKPLLVRVYVDGLNYHYNVARRFNVGWVDLEMLFENVLSNDLQSPVALQKTLVFTSLFVDEDKRCDQEIYYSALKAHSRNLEIKFGRMQESIKWLPLAAGRNVDVEVVDVLEKETDVRIGTEIIKDAFTEHGQEFDVACLVSDDRDMKAVSDTMIPSGKRLLWLSPKRAETKDENRFGVNRFLRHELIDDCQVTTEISRQLLIDCQMPESVNGYRPPDVPGWRIVAE